MSTSDHQHQLKLKDTDLMRIKEALPKYAVMDLSMFKSIYFAGPYTLPNFLVSELKDIIRILRTSIPGYAHLTLVGNKIDLVQKLADACFHVSAATETSETASVAPSSGAITAATTTTTTVAHRASPRVAPYTTTPSRSPLSTAQYRQRTPIHSFSSPPSLSSSSSHPLPSVQSLPPTRFGEMADLSSLTPAATPPSQQQSQQQFSDMTAPVYSYAQLAQRSPSRAFSGANMSSLLQGLADQNSGRGIFASATDGLQNLDVPVEVIKPAGKTSGALRKETDEEIHIREKIEGDRTLRGYQNPYYEIVTVLDVKKMSGSPHNSWEFAVNERELQKMRTKQSSSVDDENLDVHIYFYTDQLQPSNTRSEFILHCNGIQIPVKQNKKISLIKDGKLISATPAVVPRLSLYDVNSISFMCMNFMNFTGVIITALIRNRTTEELMEQVEQQTAVYDAAQKVQERQGKDNSVVGRSNTRASSSSSSVSHACLKFKELQDGRTKSKDVSLNQPPSVSHPVIKTNTHNFGISSIKNDDDDDDDDVITADAETVNLRDPISHMRIEIAARGVKCIHKARFDLQTYLEFTKTSSMWCCPCCDSSLPVKDLLIDSRFNRILETTDESISQVRMFNDGRFEPIHERARPKNWKSTSSHTNISTANGESKQTVIQLDDDIIELD